MMQLSLSLDGGAEEVTTSEKSIVGDKDKGGHISFASDDFVCNSEGVLYWPTHKCMIVSDLHLEKGASCARRGQLIPPYDTALTLQRLATQIAKWKPETVISLGDSFHDEKSASCLPQPHIRQLKGMTKNLDWIWVTGNHDPCLPDFLDGEIAHHIQIDSINFTHEPSLSLCAGQYEVCGHLHPKARITQRGKRISRKCFALDQSRLMMPAFGAYTGGLDLSHEAFNGLFDYQHFQAILIGQERVYKINYEKLDL